MEAGEKFRVMVISPRAFPEPPDGSALALSYFKSPKEINFDKEEFGIALIIVDEIFSKDLSKALINETLTEWEAIEMQGSGADTVFIRKGDTNHPISIGKFINENPAKNLWELIEWLSCDALRHRYGFVVGPFPVNWDFCGQIEASANDSIEHYRMPTFIGGEVGVGKELVARAIHKLCRRDHNSFAVIDCLDIPANHFKLELFGAKKGIGSDGEIEGVIAKHDGGTIFLKEIGTLPLDLQSVLINVCRTQKVRPIGSSNRSESVDIRIIAATSQDIEALTLREGKFLKELFFRLYGIPIHVPPLRERIDEIPYFIERFLSASLLINKEHSPSKLFLNIRKLYQESGDLLREYRWPGNIRELENCVYCAALRARNSKVGSSDLLERTWLNMLDYVRNNNDSSPRPSRKKKKKVRQIRFKDGF